MTGFPGDGTTPRRFPGLHYGPPRAKTPENRASFSYHIQSAGEGTVFFVIVQPRRVKKLYIMRTKRLSEFTEGTCRYYPPDLSIGSVYHFLGLISCNRYSSCQSEVVRIHSFFNPTVVNPLLRNSASERLLEAAILQYN